MQDINKGFSMVVVAIGMGMGQYMSIPMTVYVTWGLTSSIFVDSELASTPRHRGGLGAGTILLQGNLPFCHCPSQKKSHLGFS